ncbi:MAG: purine-nucleoside phosphorylase [Bacteroidota bacterium]|nr:purine-nucleoside phosphorylase [Bacteroidota bacterium]
MSSNTIEQARIQRAEAVSFIKERLPINPEYLLILGTGLGELAEEMTINLELPYKDIPHFPVSTVESHTGKLLMGYLGGKPVMAMQGRFHYYEGYSMNQIVFPIRVAKMLGIQTLLVSNACGGLNPNFERGDIMLINDHINFLGDNPLIGANDPDLGPRFPDMSQPYTKHLLFTANQVALDAGIKIHQGVYLAVSGPMLETKAEYRYMRQLGADAVGMSTVPEVIAAVHMGMKVLGVSVITDECFPDSLEPVSLDDVLNAAAMAKPQLTRIVVGMLERL